MDQERIKEAAEFADKLMECGNHDLTTHYKDLAKLQKQPVNRNCSHWDRLTTVRAIIGLTYGREIEQEAVQIMATKQVSTQSKTEKKVSKKVSQAKAAPKAKAVKKTSTKAKAAKKTESTGTRGRKASIDLNQKITGLKKNYGKMSDEQLAEELGVRLGSKRLGWMRALLTTSSLLEFSRTTGEPAKYYVDWLKDKCQVEFKLVPVK